ncbi:hypothetical protein POM88_045146 [Heracleum sosnowskyi]|uniref:Uncharacterized protein n=1 Tax=Heracleum sosnowskyi TaxID=360622 RepID=A0AAD8H6V6_9APIA|nr:hypothetical protein POM88_045146 [Heracleum sosnowskyi]
MGASNEKVDQFYLYKYSSSSQLLQSLTCSLLWIEASVRCSLPIKRIIADSVQSVRSFDKPMFAIRNGCSSFFVTDILDDAPSAFSAMQKDGITGAAANSTKQECTPPYMFKAVLLATLNSLL